MQSQGWSRISTLLGVLLLAACSKISQVGQLTQPAPTAVAATIGQPYTIDSSGVLHTTVRAGADVVLTGVNSENGTSDTGVPLIYFTWQQLNPGSNAVDLIQRNTDTSSFTAPQVTQSTVLTFQLTVGTANGATASTQAQVTVEPVRDPDHFLNYLGVNDQFTVTAASDVAIAGSQTASSPTIPYTITVTKLVSYTDINGVQHTQVPVGQPVSYSGAWSSVLGNGGANCADARNPQTQIPIPRLNLDDELADGSGRLSDVMEFSDINLDPANANIPPAVVYAQVQIQSTAVPNGTTPQVCIGSGTAASSPAPMSSDALIAASNSATALYDTSASSHAYYNTIDPNATKTTLTQWLSANGFNPAVNGWGADAHAVYTNNYDLGFGRDMYMKVGNCDSGYNAAPLSQFAATTPLSSSTTQALQQLVGHCDVAAVVVNYVGVQAAAEHINEIVAVAMEYSAVTAGGARFVKFYVYAPDTRTGISQRITSVDLDHRGQKPVPQACVVCHGGTPATPSALAAAPANTYPSTAPSGINGDLNAGFLSWDLASLLYSDTDPGFSQKAEDAALKAQYTLANQQAQLKLLNVGAYLTTDNSTRFALERELLEGWYGGAGLPGAFSGSFVPPSWQPGGTSANPADSATLYSNVFASNCRMCHIMQAPPVGIDPRTAAGQNSSNAAVPACSSTAVLSGAAGLDQVPMGCYWEFANARNLPQRLSYGQMPFARRTADRLWVQPDGSMSAGTTLQTHFAAQSPALTISTPGTSIASFANPPSTYSALTDTAAVSPLDIGDAVRLDATGSAFPDLVSWSVMSCGGTLANLGACQGSLPVVGSASTLGWFLPTDAGTYQLTLSLDGGQGLAAAAPYYFQVPLIIPQFVSPTPTITLQVGSQQSVQLSTLIDRYGNGGAANNLVLLTAGAGLSIAPTACTTAPGCAASSLSQGFTLSSTGGTPMTSSVTVTVQGLGSSASEQQTESVPVTLAVSVQAPAIFLTSVAANTTTPTNTNLLTAAGGAGAYPNCASVQVANVAYQGGRHSVWSFASVSQTLSYTPQAGFATYSHGGVKQLTCGVGNAACTQESFQYQLACTLPNTQIELSQPSTITVPVEARVSFAQVTSIWSSDSTCDICHGGGSPSAPPLGSAGYTELSAGFTDDEIGGQTWNASHIRFVDLASLSDTPPNLSSVPSSGLVCWPTETCFSGQVHSGGDQSGTSELTTIQQWIQDGANDF
jgi:mono/diheme cytochrome c family protein/cytochrome c5